MDIIFRTVSNHQVCNGKEALSFFLEQIYVKYRRKNKIKIDFSSVTDQLLCTKQTQTGIFLFFIFSMYFEKMLTYLFPIHEINSKVPESIMVTCCYLQKISVTLIDDHGQLDCVSSEHKARRGY